MIVFSIHHHEHLLSLLNILLCRDETQVIQEEAIHCWQTGTDAKLLKWPTENSLCSPYSFNEIYYLLRK